MRRSSKPLPRDPNQRAAEVARISTEENPPVPENGSITRYLAAIGRKGGLKGGPARAKKLSKKRLSNIGKKAAKARWSKRQKTQ